MIRETFAVGEMQCNCSIVACPKTREAIVVDPGGDAEEILARVKAHGLTVKQILITHAHFDHVLAAQEVQKATGAKIAVHRKDRWLYRVVPLQCKLFGGSIRGPKPPRPNRWLKEGDVLSAGTISTKVLHTPGHTPGSCCFHVQDESLLFSGDTLFCGAIGQWRYPGGSLEKILGSLDRLMLLPDETHVVPGHGPHTSIGDERKTNPYLDAAYREKLIQEEASRPSLLKSLLGMLAHMVGLRRRG